VVYQLQSIEHADRVRIRTRLTTEDAKVPTCTDLWSGASFMERECWDLMGIDFEGHPDMRRLLMPDGYGHHPLRKEFPHQGIEPDRLYREWDTARRKEWDAERAAAKQAQAKG
jgi:NADH-quinone oxidoreductase subunit C